MKEAVFYDTFEIFHLISHFKCSKLVWYHIENEVKMEENYHENECKKCNKDIDYWNLYFEI